MTIIVLSATILILLQPKKIDDVYLDPEDVEYNISLQKKFKNLDKKTEYFIIKSCLFNYYDSISNLYMDYNMIYDTQEEIEETKKYNINVLYNMLFTDYIKEFAITEDTLKNKYSEIEEKFSIILNNVIYYDINENISLYIVNGNVISNKNKMEINIGLVLDFMNNTYAVLPYEYLSKHKIDTLKLEDELELNISEIKNNVYNVFEYKNKTNEDMVQEYFDISKINLLYDIEQSYSNLDEEYKKAKFESLEEYKKYIKKNYIEINISRAKNYVVNNYDDYIQYIVYDQYDNCYIFNATSILDYKIMLDSYTIDIPKFIEQYNEANAQEKCILDIQKVEKALNKQDYKFVYNKLADSFKTNYFPTQASFEQYMKNNFFAKNKITYSDVEIQNNNYIFKIQIADENNLQSTQIEKTVVIQLKEGTDFVFSFSV